MLAIRRWAGRFPDMHIPVGCVWPSPSFKMPSAIMASSSTQEADGKPGAHADGGMLVLSRSLVEAVVKQADQGGQAGSNMGKMSAVSNGRGR